LHWVIAILTTVGYGDAYPVTGIGKFLGSLIDILRISAILSEAFNSVKDDYKIKKIKRIFKIFKLFNNTPPSYSKNQY
jgi:voltage-gated potassium channel